MTESLIPSSRCYYCPFFFETCLLLFIFGLTVFVFVSHCRFLLFCRCVKSLQSDFWLVSQPLTLCISACCLLFLFFRLRESSESFVEANWEVSILGF